MSRRQNDRRRPVPEQPSLPALCPVEAAVTAMAGASIEERGAVFTRREVVDFILDLSAYTLDKPLHRKRLLEPAFGELGFLISAIGRLLTAWRAAGGTDPVQDLADCIVAVELHQDTFARSKEEVIRFLQSTGIAPEAARALAGRWLVQGDFLLLDIPGEFDFCIGNPPYVRLERIPDPLMATYRARYATLYDRADLYVAFVERGLGKLARGGRLGFICADRWMKNKYGGPLRRLVAEGGFHLRTYVDMVDTPAFHSDVIAYPAITVIAREAPGHTRVALRPRIEAAALASLATALTADNPPEGAPVRELARVPNGAEPWLLESSDQLAIVRRLEDMFPTIEEAGCKVGIGVATGADEVFIAPYEELDVEEDRKLPLVTTEDIVTGEVVWRGLGVVNPHADDNVLVRLKDYPRLRRYLERHKDRISRRHCVRKTPANWYRTIDRIHRPLAGMPKLLIPDIKGEANIVHEDGRLYPHHNLYYIVSESWDLKALQAVLRSGIAKLFIATYSTQMRGGYLRWQAQYLRRIRLPRWDQVPEGIKRDLSAAAERGDAAARNAAAFRLYGLTDVERESLGGNGG